MNRTGVKLGVVALAAITFLVGCGNRNKPKVQPTVDTENAAAGGDIYDRTAKLREAVETFNPVARQMPGYTEAEHRALMADVFNRLGQILPLLESSRPSGAFRQQVQIITASGNQLATGGSELASGPAIDSGLRAAARALMAVNDDMFAGQGEAGAGDKSGGGTEAGSISGALEQLQGKIGELDASRGPMHRLVVGQSVRLIDNVLVQMTNNLVTRVGERPVSPAPAASSAEMNTTSRPTTGAGATEPADKTNTP